MNIRLKIVSGIEPLQGMRSADASALSDANAEIGMLRTDVKSMRLKIRTLQETIDNLTARNSQLMADLQASNIVDTAGGLSDHLLAACTAPSSSEIAKLS